MVSVSALSDEDKARLIKMSYKVMSKYNILLVLGFSTGLRVSDILQFKVMNVSKKTKIIEKKTGKEKTIHLDTDTLYLLKKYVRKHGLKKDEYLVHSTNKERKKPLSRIQAYRVIKRLTKHLGIENAGTHTMRKTYAREYMQKNKDIEGLQRELNHKYVSTTIGYLLDKKTVNNLF